MWRQAYRRVIRLAAHRRAPAWLAGLAFAESAFFPIPPDVMLAPMTLARPERAWRYALIATTASVAGGLLGYLIGLWFIDAVLPWLATLGYEHAYARVRGWFSAYGFWAVLFAGVSPVPYKLFTIAAGAVDMALLPFVAASAVGRGARFYLIAGLARALGPTFEQRFLQYLDWIGWTIVALALIGFLIVRLA